MENKAVTTRMNPARAKPQKRRERRSGGEKLSRNERNDLRPRARTSRAKLYSLARRRTSMARQTAKIPPATTWSRRKTPNRPRGLNKANPIPLRARNMELQTRTEKTNFIKAVV
jgi:hypothetical protein